jgi:tetratricopeptide (TPR) repeat protein
MATTNPNPPPNTLTSLNRRTGCGGRQRVARSRFQVDDEVLHRLRKDVLARRVTQSLQWVDENRIFFPAIDPEHPNAAPFVGYLSQWVGHAQNVVEAVRELLRLFPQADRGRLPLNAYLQLQMADGVVNFTDGNTTAAGAHFDFIISLESRQIDPELAALAHFWKALCERDHGDFDGALEHATRARAASIAAGYSQAAAVMQAMEGSLHVDKRRFEHAMELLREADAVLLGTTDTIWRGNIQLAYGGIALEEGRYELALDHFMMAISHYRHGNSRTPNLPEALTSLGQAQRLVAVRTARAVDLCAERRRRSAQRDRAGSGDQPMRRNIEQLRQEASANLKDAVDMFAFLGQAERAALARVEIGLLFMDCGQFDHAAIEACEAFELGCKIKDWAVMGYSRLLQSRIESARYEEGIGDSPPKHAQRARDFAQEAVKYALLSQDPRLLASAYNNQGLIFCNEFFKDAEAAAECCLQASQFLIADNRTQLWDEHQCLRKKVTREGAVDARLREWTQGLVQGKTFQQMTEEFAEVVIPKVWEREGRNVSRVVAKLSISPKKVRRILIRAGFKPGTS